jgi:hypothetical protein
METLGIALVVLGMWAIYGSAIFGIVYIGARLAIRHERRISNLTTPPAVLTLYT